MSERVTTRDTLRVRCIRTTESSVMCEGGGARFILSPGEFERMDFRPRAGQSFDLTVDVTTDGVWNDGMGRILLFAPVGVANVEEGGEGGDCVYPE